MDESQFETGDFHGVPIVTVRGDVDMHSAPALRSVLDRACNGHDNIIVDLRDCRYMDSSGLTVLIHLRKTLTRPFPVIVQSDAFIRRLFKMTGIDSVCELYEDTESLPA